MNAINEIDSQKWLEAYQNQEESKEEQKEEPAKNLSDKNLNEQSSIPSVSDADDSIVDNEVNLPTNFFEINSHVMPI